MLQKEYSIDLVEIYLKNHPNPKNKLLYSFCNATTDSQKQCVRRKKLALQKPIIPPESKNKKYKKINSETIEAVLLEGANTGNTNLANLARCMIDFFVKIKGKTDEIEEDIDMEALKEIGINIKSGS